MVVVVAAAAAAVVHTAPCSNSARQRLTRSLRRSRPWQGNGRLGSGPTRGQKWPREALSECPERSFHPCSNTEAMATRILATGAVRTAMPRSTGTRWPFSTSPAPLSDWPSALPCGRKAESWCTTRGRRRHLSRAKYRRRSSHRLCRETRRFRLWPTTSEGRSQPRTIPATARPPGPREVQPGSPSNCRDSSKETFPLLPTCHSLFRPA